MRLFLILIFLMMISLLSINSCYSQEHVLNELDYNYVIKMQNDKNFIDKLVKNRFLSMVNYNCSVSEYGTKLLENDKDFLESMIKCIDLFYKNDVKNHQKFFQKANYYLYKAEFNYRLSKENSVDHIKKFLYVIKKYKDAREKDKRIKGASFLEFVYSWVIHLNEIEKSKGNETHTTEEWYEIVKSDTILQKDPDLNEIDFKW